jgi:hypothetical protein
LYDFSKERFDTIWHEKNYEDSNNFTRVIEVDSVLIGDEYRKKMIVTGRNQYHHPRDYWIEGIGSVRNGLIGHIYTMPTCGYFYWEHLCYEENGEVMYLNPSFSNCYPSDLVSSTLPEKSPAGINIYPNPVTAELHIDCLSYNAERIKVRIINPLGQTIIEQNLHSTHNTFSLPGREGMFIVLILDQTGKIMKTEKIIHQ